MTEKILVGIFSFAVLIITHEMGHYISALLFKIRVSEFSIGFGPKIISKTKNGITYKLSLFPIGGYVQMPEKLDVESSEGVPFSKAGTTAKITTLLAGSVSNILFGYLVVLFVCIFVENGHLDFEAAKLFENFKLANDSFKNFLSIIFDSFKNLLSGGYGLKDLSGPIGITEAITESLNSSTYSYLIMLSFIAVNIGVFNLLPIPALDGARALFCLIEAVFGRKIPVKIQEGIHNVGLTFLVGLIIVVTFKDIYGLIFL